MDEQDSPKKERDFIAAVLATAGALVIVLDREGRIVRFNRACERLTGFAFDQLRGKPFWDHLLIPEEVEQVKAVFSELRAGHFPNEHENYWVTKEGGRRLILWSNTAMVDERGAVERVIGTGIDITERKRAEEALERVRTTLERRVQERTAELRRALDEVAQLKDKLESENIYLREEIRSTHGYEEIVGESIGLREVLYKVRQVASTDASVLLLGETGTGKELIAHAIHKGSLRSGRSLVRVNCAALPSTLIESELFGHEKGAFTGAHTTRVGRFELADGGTIFLDEISDLPLELQSKLLRILQDGRFEKLGSTVTQQVDVRVVTACNCNLEEAVARGSFRSDLYYRLGVFPIEIPPLRERSDDIPMLVWHFINNKQGNLGREISNVPADVMEALKSYAWPGNVRELENVIERALILSAGDTLYLDESFSRAARAHPSPPTSSSLKEVERAHILNVVEDCGWRIKGKGNAAERLGINPSTLRDRMKRLGITRRT
jgi:chemotaxis protein methyltransferase CheR